MGLNINMYVIKREERYTYYSELINLFNPINMTYHLIMNTSIYLTWAIIIINISYKNKMKGNPIYYKMTFEEFTTNLDSIRNSGDEALTSLEYTALTDYFNTTREEIDERDKTIDDLRHENEQLRDINSRLQLDYGKTVIKEEKTIIKDDDSDNEEVSDEEFIEAINDLF